MVIKIKKKHLSRISVYIIIVLFTMCVIMNVLLCSNYNSYKLLNGTTAHEMWTTSENVVANEDGDSTTDLEDSLLNKNNSYNEILKKSISSILVIAAIPQEISLLLYVAIVFLFFLLTFFYYCLMDGH